MDIVTHWNEVWASKAFSETSWYQADPTPSLDWIDRAIADGGSIEHVIDAGCGTSFLADRLLDRGATVLGIDIAIEAVERTRRRVSSRPDDGEPRFHGVVADLGTRDALPGDLPPTTLWHDRAVLHFLHGAARRRYADTLRTHLVPGGHAVIAGFASDGPLRCSGLDVVRASTDDVSTLLGEAFEVVDAAIETHRTPWDAAQAFQWTLLRRHA